MKTHKILNALCQIKALPYIFFSLSLHLTDNKVKGFYLQIPHFLIIKIKMFYRIVIAVLYVFKKQMLIVGST